MSFKDCVKRKEREREREDRILLFIQKSKKAPGSIPSISSSSVSFSDDTYVSSISSFFSYLNLSVLDNAYNKLKKSRKRKKRNTTLYKYAISVLETYFFEKKQLEISFDRLVEIAVYSGRAKAKDPKNPKTIVKEHKKILSNAYYNFYRRKDVKDIMKKFSDINTTFEFFVEYQYNPEMLSVYTPEEIEDEKRRIKEYFGHLNLNFRNFRDFMNFIDHEDVKKYLLWYYYGKGIFNGALRWLDVRDWLDVAYFNIKVEYVKNIFYSLDMKDDYEILFKIIENKEPFYFVSKSLYPEGYILKR